MKIKIKNKFWLEDRMNYIKLDKLIRKWFKTARNSNLRMNLKKLGQELINHIFIELLSKILNYLQIKKNNT